jgi:hypothetical protein
VRSLRSRYDDIAVIVPGWAKSAGTIMVMAADEILMDSASAVGPIDAQIFWQGKVFSADALLEGFEKIKKEVEDTQTLNRAYIPILQGISPGELQSAENALKFAKILVTEWLVRYKFKGWAQHSSTGAPVTEAEKKLRAEEIAGQLCDHRRWLTHGRSIKVADLEAMRLRITDYGKNADLADAIRRYYTLLQMTFSTNIYKVFETPTSQVYRFIAPQVPPPQPAPASGEAEVAIIEADCGKCHTRTRVQANLGESRPLQTGCVPFPSDNKLACPNCGTEMDPADARRQIEGQAKKPVVV